MFRSDLYKLSKLKLAIFLLSLILYKFIYLKLIMSSGFLDKNVQEFIHLFIMDLRITLECIKFL
jgi:hypothetical protein